MYSQECKAVHLTSNNIQLRVAEQVLMSGTGREERFEQLVMPLSSTDYLKSVFRFVVINVTPLN